MLALLLKPGLEVQKKVPAIDLLSCLFPGTHYSSAVGKHLSFFSIYSCP